MTDYIITVNNGTETGTIRPDVGFFYELNLNEINKAEIKIFGSGTAKRGLVTEGATVSISRNGTVEFKGHIDMIDFFDGGGMSVSISGYEIWLKKEIGAYASSPWNSTASATIAAAIIGEATQPVADPFTAGTINAGDTITSFRLSTSNSLWEALRALTTRTGQDIGIDYINTEIDVLDHLGSSTAVAVLNDGLQIKNVGATKTAPIGNYVVVYGKGDGATQIKSNPASYGVDATSVSTYGQITRYVTDKRLNNQTDVDALADKEVALTKDPTKIYDFDVLNPTSSFDLGDVVTINAPDKDIDAESARIVSIKRGMKGNNEFLSLQVTNTGFSKKISDRNDTIREITNKAKNTDTYMQGSTNEIVVGGTINANSSVPLIINFRVPSSMKDEAGVMRIISMDLDYDVDKFKQQIGSASFDGGDPQVQNASAGTTPSSLAGVSVGASTTASPGEAGFLHMSEALSGSVSYWTTQLKVTAANYTGSAQTITLKRYDPADGVETALLNYELADSSGIVNTATKTDGDLVSGYFYAWDDNTVVTHVAMNVINVYSHTHGSHTHNNGDYDVLATDIDNISIGDGVGEAGSTNASQVSIYLDYYDSGWVNKHSVLNTGKTLDQGLDIAYGSSYPDNTGLWRVRIFTDSASADFVQGIVRLKGAVDG